MTDFGAFVELEPGIDALLHVSQISREHVAKPSDVLKVGQEIEAKVVDFNAQDHKISLSMKALEPEPEAAEKAPEEAAAEIDQGAADAAAQLKEEAKESVNPMADALKAADMEEAPKE
jgi:ribosomal protein S1